MNAARAFWTSTISTAIVIAALTSSTLGRAATASGDKSAPSPITIELLTMGPGEHPFFKFGHNAIRVRDAGSGRDWVYNYGTFSFDSPTLIADFFKGRLWYWLSRAAMKDTLEEYSSERRGLVAQRLDLTPAQAVAVRRALELNFRPENRAYRYDYFFDNCSTRVRDVIDRVTDGAIRRSLTRKAGRTLRDHALRSTADYFPEYLVLSIGLGPLVDRPIDVFQEAFLPERLREAMRTVVVASPEGGTKPLVASESVLLAQRDPRPERPPRWTGRFLGTGIATGSALVGLGMLARRRRGFVAPFATVISLLGTVSGLLGMALLALWAFTDHAVAYRNQNALLLSPLALTLPVHAFRIARRGASALATLRWPTFGLVLSSAVALLLKAFPFEWQDNGCLIAFFLPCWVGLSVAANWPRTTPFGLTSAAPSRDLVA
ncbi:MAG: DUF4105 domain-containing protein [Polyangiaceae bacterium]